MTTDGNARARIRRSTARPRWHFRVGVFCAGGLIWGGWAWWTARSDRNAITEIELAMKTGRFGTAARMLTAYLDRKPDADEVAFLLGVCEQARGRNQAAQKAWARIAPGSVLSHEAILARVRLFHDQGRFAAAEQVVDDATQDPRNDSSDLRALLVPIYTQLGRIDEAERLIEKRWEGLNAKGEGASEQAIDVLRMHCDLTLTRNPVEEVRKYLEQAARMAPDDDRVWLGRANLAIRTGDSGDAKKWLDACRLRRPADIPVHRAWLSWGLATDHVDVVLDAIAHLSVDDVTSTEVNRLGAWFAARRGDVERESRELDRLIESSPADLPALEKLSLLAEKSGQAARAAELRRRKADIAGWQARYEKLHDRKQPIRDAVEMASLAELLGRLFEARVFLTIAACADPQRDDLRRSLERLSPRPAPAQNRGRSVADVLAREPGEDKLIDGPAPD